MEDPKDLKRFKTFFARNVKQSVKNVLSTDEIFQESEVHANQLVASVMLLSIILLILTIIFNEVGIYNLERKIVYPLTLYGIIGLCIPWYLSIHYQYNKNWLKYLCLFSLTLVYAGIDCMLTYKVTMIMAIPVILSSRYYSRKLTIFIAALSVIVFGLSASAGIFIGVTDLNILEIPKNSVLKVSQDLLTSVNNLNIDIAAQEKVLLLRSYLPKLFPFCIISIISILVSARGRSMVIGQDKISRDHSRVETELGVARAIQERALPIVHTLSNHPEFDLAVSMTPAKEIGGDFYDFFYVDATHLALMIADVSGKGIPAALFMMVSKIYLDNSITGNTSPGQILAEVNHHICEKDLENMFVTVWLGILDLESGKLVSANAGHEYPMLCRNGSQFELIQDKHGLVLGGMDGMRYQDMETQLYPGDTIFVYTDGIPDATNSAQERFGIDRTINALNKVGTAKMSDLVNGMKKELKNFSGDEPQFDDTTMMALKLCELKNPEGISLKPDTASITLVESYLENEMVRAGLDKKTINRINVCIDEIYPNIVQYSGALWAEASIRISDKKVIITFKDNGIPFDPLKTEEPDTTLSVEDRIPGGLGIFMTKKMMDETSYQYKDGRNVFHMVKYLNQ